MARNSKSTLATAILLILVGSYTTNAAKILAIFPFQSRSHMIIGSALFKELANRGHELTVISHFPQSPPVANYTDIYVKTTMSDVDKEKGTANHFFQDQPTTVLEKINMALNFILRINQKTCDLSLEEEAVQRLIHSEDAKFDLVIMEAFFNECFLGFVHKFNAPLIQVCTFGGAHWMGDWFGNPNPYSYVPDVFMNAGDRMNFKERLINTIMGTVWRLVRQYMYIPGQDAIMRKHFGFLKDLPSLTDIEYSTSLLFMNHHFSISFPRPLMPNMIQVGGLQVKAPNKLPQDLQDYFDQSKKGVIYFSMGSNLKSSQMPEATRNAILKGFSELEQDVLWKWETDNLPGQPKNVKIEKWLPQTDILAHPNLKFFITHGGLLSTQEALNRGVPVLGIPLFADQVANMMMAEKAGFGIMLEFKNLTAESFKWAIKELVSKPSYQENAKRLSRIFRDQPVPPLDLAVYWTEYVIRHKGARHMRSAVLDLSWYQYFLLDVIAVLALAVLSVLAISYLVLRTLIRKCRSKKVTKMEKSKKRD